MQILNWLWVSLYSLGGFFGYSAPFTRPLTFPTAEYQLLNHMNQWRTARHLPPLQWDLAAAQVSHRHSLEMQRHRYFAPESPVYGALIPQLKYQRTFGQLLQTLLLKGSSLAELRQQVQHSRLWQNTEATHVGIGLHTVDTPATAPTQLWGTLVFMHHGVKLQPLPRSLPQPGNLTLQGQVFKGTLMPSIPVTHPNGLVRQYPRQETHPPFFKATIPLRTPGRYDIELMVNLPKVGPKVAAIIPIYVGQPYPIPTPTARAPQRTFATSVQATEAMQQLLNQTRRQFGLRPLIFDPRLAYVAYRHSQHMAQGHYFAHLNPAGENALQRLQKYGGNGAISENIALDQSIDEAHYHLLASPGHRASILNPQATHAGVGVFAAQRMFYITQLFQSRH